jgi:8-oxo-dGTP pyrophosphatase MutT (NUDIX family)
MYKIFFKDRVIILTDRIDSDLSPEFGGIHKLGSEGELIKFIHDFEADESKKNAFIYHHHQKELLRRFREAFTNIHAAGGVVLDSTGKYFLTINRRGRPDLPKGKAEPGESYEIAAQREVAEECGIEPTEIMASLGSSFHVYTLDGERIFKETHWFRMTDKSGKQPVPQQEEDITSVYWLPLAEAGNFAAQTFPSIKDILTRAGLTNK